MSDQSVSEELAKFLHQELTEEPWEAADRPHWLRLATEIETIIAPRLKAEGLREAAEMHNDNDFETWKEWREAIIARADALDPPKETK